MEIVLILEVVAAVFGCVLLWQHIMQLRSRNYATSIFLACYVPLYCVYPLAGHLLSGGATSVDSSNRSVISDSYVYILYQVYNFTILTGILIINKKNKFNYHEIKKENKNTSSRYYAMCISFCVGLGVLAFIYSTGFTATELITSSRFEWELSYNRSMLLQVVSSYLIALTPVFIFYAVRGNNLSYILITLVFLIVYGLATKDRKWLIFIASGIVAAKYYKSGHMLPIRPLGIVVLLACGLILAFWQIVRETLFVYYSFGNIDLVSEIPLQIQRLLTQGDLAYYYNASITAIDMNLNGGFSIPLGLIRRQLFFFLPVDYSLGLKIEDISAIFSDAVGGEDALRRGNMPPGLFGLIVLSFEWWGAFLVVVTIPIILKYLDKYIINQNGFLKVAILSHFLSSTLLFLRGDDSSGTYFIIFSFFVLIIFKLLNILIRKL